MRRTAKEYPPAGRRVARTTASIPSYALDGRGAGNENQGKIENYRSLLAPFNRNVFPRRPQTRKADRNPRQNGGRRRGNHHPTRPRSLSQRTTPHHLRQRSPVHRPIEHYANPDRRARGRGAASRPNSACASWRCKRGRIAATYCGREIRKASRLASASGLAGAGMPKRMFGLASAAKADPAAKISGSSTVATRDMATPPGALRSPRPTWPIHTRRAGHSCRVRRIASCNALSLR
jgi:hypothetical protein